MDIHVGRKSLLPVPHARLEEKKEGKRVKKYIVSGMLVMGLLTLNAGCGCGKGKPAGSCYSQVPAPSSQQVTR